MKTNKLLGRRYFDPMLALKDKNAATYLIGDIYEAALLHFLL